MASRYKEWIATWGLSELEMGFRAMKLDESTLDVPKLTGWGNEEAQLEVRRGMGFWKPGKRVLHRGEGSAH